MLYSLFDAIASSSFTSFTLAWAGFASAFARCANYVRINNIFSNVMLNYFSIVLNVCVCAWFYRTIITKADLRRVHW